ncbi:MAG: hypothetical protein H0T62_14350 [Parachlamydiaceae bacterium]|nr:hypothetical protein [Parachlamydiaceae bacterium]
MGTTSLCFKPRKEALFEADLTESVLDFFNAKKQQKTTTARKENLKNLNLP